MRSNVKPRQSTARLGQRFAFGLSLLFLFACPVVLAQTITSSGLNTAVSGPISLPNGQTQVDITGGTRPGGGGNVFHSFEITPAFPHPISLGESREATSPTFSALFKLRASGTRIFS